MTYPHHHHRRRLRAIVALPSLVLLAFVGAPALADATSPSVDNPDPDLVARWEPCAPDTGVTVIVDYEDLGDHRVYVGCALGEQESGTEALRSAGFAVQGTRRWGDGFVCRIDQLPPLEKTDCDDTPSGSYWWSYWKGRPGGQWRSSAWGAADPRGKPEIGDVEGWSFHTGGGRAEGPRVLPQDSRGIDALTPRPRPYGPDAARDAGRWLAAEVPTLIADTNFTYSGPDTARLLQALRLTGDPDGLAPDLGEKLTAYLMGLRRANPPYRVYGYAIAWSILGLHGDDAVDLTDFAGYDLRQVLLGQIAGAEPPTTRIQPGQLMNFNGSAFSAEASISNQAAAVQALAITGGAPRPAVDYLLGKQRTEGCFGAGADCSGDDAYLDTAPALEALIAARAGGTEGLDDSITRAADWLSGRQRDDGSIRSRTASTTDDAKAAAHVIPALVAAGRTVAAQRAARWLSQFQIVEEYAGDGPGQPEIGMVVRIDNEIREAVRYGVTNAGFRQQFYRPLTIAALRAFSLAPYGDPPEVGPGGPIRSCSDEEPPPGCPPRDPEPEDPGTTTPQPPIDPLPPLGTNTSPTAPPLGPGTGLADRRNGHAGAASGPALWTPARGRVVRPSRRTGRLTLARVTCRHGPCTITVPRRTVVRIAGKSYAVRVWGAHRASGRRVGVLRLRLARSALRRLDRAAVRPTVSVPITVRSRDATVQRTVRLRLR